MRTLEWLNAASEEEFVGALAGVFEHSSWIVQAAVRHRPFASLAALRDTLMQSLSDMPAGQRLSFIRVHPDLANRIQRAEGLTADSTSEQDSAGLDRLSEREMTLFETLNASYKAKFGFPFILCVKRHTRDSILDQFSQRLDHSQVAEEAAAIAEIRRIATLRLAQLVSASDTLPVHGMLSIQVDDETSGRPADGIAVELTELSRLGENRRIATATTNRSGETDQPLIHGRPIPAGSYEIHIGAGGYFRRGAATAPLSFDIIPVRFLIAEPEGQLRIVVRIAPAHFSVQLGD